MLQESSLFIRDYYKRVTFGYKVTVLLKLPQKNKQFVERTLVKNWRIPAPRVKDKEVGRSRAQSSPLFSCPPLLLCSSHPPLPSSSLPPTLSSVTWGQEHGSYSTFLPKKCGSQGAVCAETASGQDPRALHLPGKHSGPCKYIKSSHAIAFAIYHQDLFLKAYVFQTI